jgi:L-alanine-DL-glutamate epimerase-like enolase superfamily enzyme
MQIAAMEVHVVEADQPFAIGGELTLRPANVIVRLETDDGIEGVGTATANFGGHGIARSIADMRPLILGKDPRFRERLWQTILDASVVVMPPQVLASIDCALWDLAGRQVNLPVYQMLGAYRDRLPCYASTRVYPETADYLSIIDDYAALGFRAFKLHGWGEADRDMALCRAVRRHVGAEYALMLDAVGAYSISDALKVGRTLEELEFEWFEMPIRDQALWGYQQIAAALDIPITSGEVHTFSFQEAASYLMARAWDILRIDATISGGITGAYKAAALAEAFGTQCELHSFGYALALAANLQVAGAIRNCRYLEVPVPLDGYDLGMEGGIYIDRNAEAHLPDGPGLGLTVDWETMRQSVSATY